MPVSKSRLRVSAAGALLLVAACSNSTHKSSSHAAASGITTSTLAATTTSAATASSPAAPTTSTTKPNANTTTTRPKPTIRGTDIAITSAGYQPSTFTIARGKLVNVTNNDKVNHTVTADDGSFDTGIVEPGGVSHPFIAPNRPGTYHFHDTAGSSFRGTLVVT